MKSAFADKLFPGFSTIQTRAKYFASVPYLFYDYRQLDLNVRRNLPLAEFIQQQENQLAKNLVRNHSENMPYGIIGKDSLEKGVARRPSSVYWNGLRQFGIAKTDVSLKDFIEQFEQYANYPNDAHVDDDEQLSSLARMMTKSTDYHPNWSESATIALSKAEAEFLRDMLLLSKNIEYSIPAQLVKHKLLEKALELDDALESGIWRIDALYQWLKSSAISSQTKSCLEKALEFCFVLEGAHIRYNSLIAERANNTASQGLLVEEFQIWLREAQKHRHRFKLESINEWYLCAFGIEKNSNSRTRQFIEQWCNLIMNNATEDKLDKCIKQQAIANKGPRCLLKKALSDQQDWVGMRKLEFRWPTAKIILQDIHEGLYVSA
ncbi:DUF6361 family protein [Shewanella sp. SG41-4]|uniref:DUF6361 family protein n=1 Tax=Shewanella sp. SG41-4 TaxID=2760976 RepID=UPI003FA7DB95